MLKKYFYNEKYEVSIIDKKTLEKGFTANIEKTLKAIEILKDLAKVYDVEFCDKDQTMSFKVMLRNKFVLEIITINDKEKYVLLREVLL